MAPDDPDVLDLGELDDPRGRRLPPSPLVRRTRPGRRLVVALGVLVVAGGLLSHAARAPAAPPETRARAPSALPSPVASAGPRSDPSSPRAVRRLTPPVSLAGTGRWELFGRGDGVLVGVQPSRAVASEVPLPFLASNGPAAFVALRDRVLIRPLDPVAGYVVRDGQKAAPAPGLLAEGGLALPGPDGDHVWVEVGDGAPVMRLVGVDGRPAGPAVPLPAETSPFSLLPDGDGGLLLSAIGGVYAVTSDGMRRATTGVVLAVGRPGWLALECDRSYRCALVMHQRSGATRTVGGAGTYGAGSFNTLGSLGTVSPDGSVAAVLSSPGSPPVVDLLDLRSGRRTRLAIALSPDAGSGSMAWTPDGRALLVLDARGRLQVVNPASGAFTELAATLPPLRQIAVRPAS